MNAILKRRMAATQQASELQASDEAYQQIFQRAPPSAPSEICDLPLDKLDSFFTADIGFKPYSPAKLEAFAQQLQEEGLLVRIIVRRIPHSDRYEILAGHNRTAAARLAGWTKIAAEIVVADDARAISIATLTNLLQRQDLSRPRCTGAPRCKRVRAGGGPAFKRQLTADAANPQHGVLRPAAERRLPPFLCPERKLT